MTPTIPKLLLAVRAGNRVAVMTRIAHPERKGFADYYKMSFLQKVEVMKYLDQRVVGAEQTTRVNAIWDNDTNLGEKIVVGMDRLHSIGKRMKPETRKGGERILMACLRDYADRVFIDNSIDGILVNALTDIVKKFGVNHLLAMTEFLEHDSWGQYARDQILLKLPPRTNSERISLAIKREIIKQYLTGNFEAVHQLLGQYCGEDKSLLHQDIQDTFIAIQERRQEASARQTNEDEEEETEAFIARIMQRFIKKWTDPSLKYNIMNNV